VAKTPMTVFVLGLVPWADKQVAMLLVCLSVQGTKASKQIWFYKYAKMAFFSSGIPVTKNKK
jgi:hypothetical protein